MTNFLLTFVAKNGDKKGMSVLNVVVVLEDGDMPMLCPCHRGFLVKCRDSYVYEEADQKTLEEVLHGMKYLPYNQVFKLSFKKGVLRVCLCKDILNSTDRWDILSPSGEKLDARKIPSEEEWLESADFAINWSSGLYREI